MTLTLELPPEAETAIEAAAAAHGQGVKIYVESLVLREAMREAPAATPKRRRVLKSFGAFAGLGGDSGEIRRDRRAEVEAEGRGF